MTSAAQDDAKNSSAGGELSRGACYLILIVAFLGWGFGGVHLAITGLVMRVATVDLLREGTTEAVIGSWFGWLTCAFLLGAATGGYVFGYVGDRYGRARAMSLSILCYSCFSAMTYFAGSVEMLLVMRFLTCLGLGGMWPNGIALVSEAWSNVSRPILAGIMGTSANVGILLFATLTLWQHVTVDDWRWTMLFGATPIVLGLISLLLVPESPRWLALQSATDAKADDPKKAEWAEVFKPPILRTTVIGILLGAVPLFGGWGVSNWAIAWASEVGDRKAERTPGAPEKNAPEKSAPEKNAPEKSDPGNRGAADKVPPTKDSTLKSKAVIYRSLPGSISSLLGGAVAFYLGRKRSYFLLCLAALVCTQFLFRVDSPSSDAFKYWNAALGLCSGFFFGWLPLCLPEMFPTRVRSTGAGISFNWGRILTAIGILVTAAVLKEKLQGRYADAGQITGLVYLVGMVVILLAPSQAGVELVDET